MFGNKFLLLIGHEKNDIQNRLINLLHKISIMEKSIKGTRTEQNLLKSFAGESQARSRYTFFASVAKKEGYEQIAGVFMETAEQEKEWTNYSGFDPEFSTNNPLQVGKDSYRYPRKREYGIGFSANF